MPKIVELRQDRSLICSNFDGYKLSLESVPLLRQELQTAPHKAEPNEDQYSLLHAELFAMQNLLQADPWARHLSYFVNISGEVVRSNYNVNTGRFEPLQVVFRMADVHETRRRISGDYNYSMRFISEKYCVLCDGIQQLVLLDTGDRLKAAEWKEVARTVIFSGEDERNFTIYDCRLDIINEQKEISLALGRVQRVEADGNGAAAHYLHLHWAKWVFKDTWQFIVWDTLEGKGSLHYCAFEPRAESLIISSNREIVFRSQKDKVVAEEDFKAADDERPHLHGGATDASGFSWSQADEDLTIKFDAQLGMEKNDFNIECTGTQLTVKCGSKNLLENTLYGKVDKELTTWSIESGILELTLVKETAALWPSLLPDGNGPNETLNKASEVGLPADQQPIVNLEAPIEDCDFPISTTEDENKIGRFHLPSTSITHTVLLGPTPPLFATSLRPGFPLALATRQDVDACLWLQQYNPAKPNEWSLRHEGNLNALGYIQASKQQKKFMNCSPDLSYAVICESYRHIFLYKSQYETASGLRNRNGPQVSIGKQHLITLEEDDEVLGIVTSPAVVTLLTERAVLYLQLN